MKPIEKYGLIGAVHGPQRVAPTHWEGVSRLTGEPFPTTSATGLFARAS
ncbi:hypothetical protein [Streptomyces sp. NPDC047999]